MPRHALYIFSQGQSLFADTEESTHPLQYDKSIHPSMANALSIERERESFCTSVITDITNTTTTDIPSLSSNISMTCFCRARRLPYNLICIYPPYSKLKHSQVRVSSSVICIEMYKYVYIRVSICQKFTLQLMHVY